MATITVKIDREGTLSPANIEVNAEDIVCFEAEADAVLCVDPAKLFGSERFEIPGGKTVCLVVLPNPPERIAFLTRMGDLEARCRGDKGTGGTGGGGSGDGPG